MYIVRHSTQGKQFVKAINHSQDVYIGTQEGEEKTGVLVNDHQNILAGAQPPLETRMVGKFSL